MSGQTSMHPWRVEEKRFPCVRSEGSRKARKDARWSDQVGTVMADWHFSALLLMHSQAECQGSAMTTPLVPCVLVSTSKWRTCGSEHYLQVLAWRSQYSIFRYSAFQMTLWHTSSSSGQTFSQLLLAQEVLSSGQDTSSDFPSVLSSLDWRLGNRELQGWRAALARPSKGSRYSACLITSQLF